MKKRAIVVGAGIGGLATAARLAKAGYEVQVFEQRDQVGGRAGEWRHEGYRFDTGPTLLMMLEPLETLFNQLDRRLEDYLTLSLCQPSYRVFYGDGTQLDSSPTIAHMTREISQKIDPDDVPGYLRLMSDLSAMFHDVMPAFVRRNYDHIGQFLSAGQIRLLLKHHLLAKLHSRVARYVKDERLRMLFSFQTMYLGLSPAEAPWVYGVLTYMESGEGVWYPKGGMHQLPLALRRVAEEDGAEINLNAPVCKVLTETGKASGVLLENGERVVADTVVINTDLPTAYERLLGKKNEAKNRRWRNSCSANLYFIGYDGELPQLLHHNVFFSRDFQGNLHELFVQKRIPNDPSFYACVTRRADPEDAPEHCENLYLLVPVPNLSGEDAAAASATVLDKALQRLCEVGLSREKIQFARAWTPHDWEAMGLWQGAAFGLSHDFFQSAYFRPTNRHPSIPGVYFVGASTQPGNGIPMTLISAELTTERVLREAK